MSQYSADQSRQIQYRAIATGDLVLETPTHFGTGDTNGTEAIILQDAVTGKPLLTGASLAGALRGHLLSREIGYRNSDDKNTFTQKLFGQALDNERVNQSNQSRIIIHDAVGVATDLTIREGVKIDPKYRIAQDSALFSLQTWAEGTSFSLRLELIIYKDDDSDKLKQAFATLLNALKNAEIPLGARKNRGYGRCCVKEWTLREYQSDNLNHFLNWLTDEETQPNTYETFSSQYQGFIDHRRYLSLTATFALTDSLIIRAGADLVDNTHLSTVDKKPILSGTSITGALRARASKILRTIGIELQTIIDDLFGQHGSENNTQENLTASRLKVAESVITDGETNLIQNRVKIDRFTGGAYETALISQQPVFAKPQTQVEINLNLEISESMDYEAQQIGLILLLLKDLWTQDLPLGGEASIGRGRLRGLYANLEIHTQETEEICTFNEHGLDNVDNISQLQIYVDKLWETA